MVCAVTDHVAIVIAEIAREATDQGVTAPVEIVTTPIVAIPDHAQTAAIVKMDIPGHEIIATMLTMGILGRG